MGRFSSFSFRRTFFIPLHGECSSRAEHWTVAPGVGGSKPLTHPNFYRFVIIFSRFFPKRIGFFPTFGSTEGSIARNLSGSTPSPDDPSSGRRTSDFLPGTEAGTQGISRLTTIPERRSGFSENAFPESLDLLVHIKRVPADGSHSETIL